jgi:hypothetical protein
LACGPRGEARRGFRTAGVQRGRKKGGGRRGAAGGDGRSERERRGEGGRVGLKDRRGVGPGWERGFGLALSFPFLFLLLFYTQTFKPFHLNSK